MRLAFVDRDCKRWDLTGPIEVFLLDIGIADLQELAKRFGFDGADWPQPFFGDIPIDQAGSPDAKPIAPEWQWQSLVWIALRQNGRKVSWDEAGEASQRTAPLLDPDESPGKGSSPARKRTRSPKSGPSTTSPSKSSGRT